MGEALTDSRGKWIPDRHGGVERVWRALTDTGMDRERVAAAMANLTSRGLIVLDGYYVPTAKELYNQYSALGVANLRDRIRVRWVMCRETYDALVAEHARQRVAVPADIVWTALKPSPETVIDIETLLVVDGGTLFGIPIRIDPAARRPMLEVVP